MTLGAVLERLVLSSPNVDALASFYGNTFDYATERVGAEQRCEAQGRSLWLRPGPPNQLVEAHFRFDRQPAYERFVARLGADVVAAEGCSADGVAVVDPEGRLLRWRCGAPADLPRGVAPDPARLQHYAVRSPDPQRLVDFYERLGFVVSDRVCDDAGALAAVFLRTDPEHHVFAIFRSGEQRFDHVSCETDDWDGLRRWADRVAARRVPIAWGVGRHGPGNDTFFMVRDPDGNLAEISSDLEVCADDRPAGLWPHEARTLNLWGTAIVRT